MKEVISVNCPADVIPVIGKYRRSKVEQFGLICLDVNGNVISKKVLFKGGYTSTTLDLRVILYHAIKARCVSVIFWHNHPSGNTEPSAQDVSSTRRLTEAFNICGMKVSDHIIIGSRSYFSFAERDLIGNKCESMKVAN